MFACCYLWNFEATFMSLYIAPRTVAVIFVTSVSLHVPLKPPNLYIVILTEAFESRVHAVCQKAFPKQLQMPETNFRGVLF